MSYWQEVRDVVLKGIDLAAEGIKEGGENIVGKTKDSVQYMNLKKDLFIKRRELHSILADLGDVTFELFKGKKDIYSDEKIQEIMAKTVEKENDCKKIEEEMKSLWNEEVKAEKKE